MSFYIERLIVSGSGKEDSIIEFDKGVNIIYGPSNTGKTYIVKCIDYLFGAEKEPIDTSTGYESIKLIVKTDVGTITMNRKIGENKIHIFSTDSKIASGRYNSKASDKNYDKTINSVWLSLIGIDGIHYIIGNESYKKQILSWRTFCHMFLLTEIKIISENSPILVDKYSNTAVLSALIFLLTDEDFSETDTKERKEIKKAKKSAVKAYINKELFRLSERNQELLAQMKEYPDVDIKQEIANLIDQIESNEQQINQAIDENKEILTCLHKQNESLSECNVLLSRYEELTTQYDADLKRLSFIIDGEANSKGDFSSQCPFCEGKIVVNRTHNYIDAAKSDYKKIKLQTKDLEKASKELIFEKDALVKEINLLMSEKKNTEELIEKELKPQISSLKERLNTYRDTIERQKEIAILKTIADQKNADIIDTETDEERTLKYKPKDHLGFDFISYLSENISSFLEDCKYENLISARFDKSDMDIIINGKKKSSNGKGYNAYFNSAVAIVLSRYMHNKAKHSPDFMVLDSPILSLKEKETQKPSETMRNALFENIVNKQNTIQTIIVENEIPDIDYNGANIIHFTKEKDKGRYGFLMEVIE